MTTYSWSDFSTLVSGVRVGADITRKGLRGMSSASTVLQMTASTSTHSADVPTAGGTTNQLYLIRFTHDDLDLSCFTLQGTDQGHLYNGIRLDGVDRLSMRNVKLLGTAPGNFYVPPGETFAINWFQGADHVYENVEIDGRQDGATGNGTGATGFGANSFSGGTWKSCYSHHSYYSGAWALWQGSGTINLYNCRGDFCRTNLNLERLGGETAGTRGACTLNVYDFEFGQYIVQGTQGDGQDIFLGNDQGNTTINIYRPKFKTGRTAPAGRDPNKIFIYYPTLEQGNTNLQTKDRVKVFDENGNDISATILQWSR